MIWAAAAVLVLLLVSALLTASREATSQISASHLRTLEEEGFGGADELRALRDAEQSVDATVRIFTTLFELSAIAVIALTGVSTWGTASPTVSTIVGVVLVVLFAEVLPHAFAARRPVRLALSSAPFLLRVARLTRPISRPVTRLEERIGGADEDESPDHRELREIQEIGAEEGVLEASENLLVERAFRIDEMTAWDVMVPRVDIFAWRQEQTVGEVVVGLEDVPYSRVPVYDGSVDDVTGIVYVRELYEYFARGERQAPLSELAREPFFVPGSLSLTQLIQDFQARRIHLGIVSDEFGGTDGLVTLEDVLEELVGEIRDETDVEEDEIVRVSEDVVECDAGVDVRELEEVAGLELPKVEHRSLNGFILEELGQVPLPGDAFERAGVRIDILAATDTQVLRARLTKLPESDAH